MNRRQPQGNKGKCVVQPPRDLSHPPYPQSKYLYEYRRQQQYVGEDAKVKDQWASEYIEIGCVL
jgi:hypothetical protein